MKPGDLLKILIVGAGGYLLYNYLVSSGMWAQWFGGASGATGLVGSGAAAAQLPAGATSQMGILPATGTTARMTVTTPSGNPAQLAANQPYSVTITGAPPNARVNVTAVQSTGQVFQNAIGNAMTDANGNYTLNAVSDPAHTGTWFEQWVVGNTPIAMWNFVLSPAAGVAGVGAIVRVPNNGPITSPLPTRPAMPSFGGGGYGNAYGGKGKTNGYVQ